MKNNGVDATATATATAAVSGHKRKFQAYASSSSADPVPAGGGAFDVFLSFCGQDTRKTFTDFLYVALDSAGIRTFIDSEELRIGEEIGPELLEAINESKISIPIFSQNYTSSKWCLRELQQMVECHENQEHMILPIFYDVDPRDVRNQSGSYKMAFSQHEENFPETVQKWRKALRVVGELKGLELKETGGHQGKLVKLVVEKVLLCLQKKHTHLPENLVGMDNHIEELTRRLEVESEDVRIIGILGMGGLGKTTIAKVIYNRLCEQFEGHCFLDDVREKSKHHNGMVDMQKQLISNILNRTETNVFDVNEGKKRINDAIRGKKLLVVLDDVDEDLQVEMLMGDLRWFGQQSRIVLTTRNKRVLDVIESNCERENPPVVYSCYKPNFMDCHAALQLFSKYAFRTDSPLQGYDILSKKVVDIAAGLPLVLVVLGSTFYAVNDTDLWEEKLVELEKIPNEDVMKKLKFSFDALKRTEQQIFLDIACFFIGHPKTRPSYMWEACGFSPRWGISVLVSRSLITLDGDDDDDIVRMHDQLRDLGRQIVNEEGSLPGEQSRLWCPKKAIEVLETGQGTSNVNALRLVSLDSVGASHFHHLPNLKYLCINNIINIDGDFKHLLPNLRWLECTNVIKFSPNNLNVKNLVVLTLYDSYGGSGLLLEDWDGWNQLKVANNLKVLNLSIKYLQFLPNLSNLTKLAELCLAACFELTEIPGLQKLESLQVLNIKSCGSLRTLPNISNLKKLKKLEGAPGLDTTDFSNFKKLKRLEIYRNNRTEIQNLDGLEALKYLKISKCSSLERLPNLLFLTRLKTLDINGCEQLTDIQDLGELKSLEVMRIGFCPSLKLIEIESRTSRLDSLKFLRISHCKSLERLADLPNLGRLQELEVDNCYKLQEVEGLGVIQSLERLKISGCFEFRKLPNLEELKSLELLHISECSSIKAIPNISNLQKLKDLDVSDCEELSVIHGLEELKSLESLKISRCSSIKAIPNISNLQKLKDLDVSWCEELSVIHGLEELCVKLCEIPGLEELKSLSTLSICRNQRLPHLSNLPNVEITEESIFPFLE